MAIDAAFSAFVKQDVWINSHIKNLWNPALNKIMIILTNVISPEIIIAVSIPLIILFIYKKQWHKSFLLAFSIMIGLSGVELLKLLARRARPGGSLIQEAGYSFPSTHSAIAIIFFILMVYFFKDHFASKKSRLAFIIANILLIFLAGFARVYLNVHWYSDVIAGFIFGILVILFSICCSRTTYFQRLVPKGTRNTYP